MSQEQVVKKGNIKQSLMVAAPTFGTLGLVDLLAHLGPNGLVAAGVLSFVGWKMGPDICAGAQRMYDGLDPETQAAIQSVVRKFKHETADVTEEEKEEEQRLAPGQAQVAMSSGKLVPNPRLSSLGVNEDVDDDSIFPVAWNGADLDRMPELRAPGQKDPFSKLLLKGFRPTYDKIYVGTLDNGEHIFTKAEHLCHVALAGITGNGKGTLMRLLMSQLCYVGAQVLMLNPHYAGYDQSGGEDWTPFERADKRGTPYLCQPPLPCAEPCVIERYLEWAANTLIPERRKRGQQYLPVGRPYFIFIDEWPSVVKKCSAAVVGYMGELLREGRKYNVFLCIASQDFQVKTIGGDGGGVRKCFKTAFYVGGDAATARALLKDGLVTQETELGGGRIWLRCKATNNEPVLCNVPYVDNEALYFLLGPSLLDPNVFRLQGAAIDDHMPEVSPATIPPLPVKRDEVDEEIAAILSRPDIENEDVRYSGNDVYSVNAVFGKINDKRGNKHPRLTRVNAPLKQVRRDQRRAFIQGHVVEEKQAQTREILGIEINDVIIKQIRRLAAKGEYSHRKIADIVGLTGPRYKVYQEICRQEGIEIINLNKKEGAQS